MSNDAKLSFEIRRTIPFYDLDPMQIVWHGNYFNYFEEARAGLLDSVGINLYDFFEKTGCIFPVIKTSTKHIKPLKYRDEMICRATVVDARNKIVVDFEIINALNGEVCTRGRTEQVAVKAPDMELLFEIPSEIRKALGYWA
jgi:acyl-CoA thioester hydrolase